MTRALARALNIADLRALAQKRLPKMVFDYIDGGADDEVTLRANVERLRAHRLVWDALADVTAIKTKVRVLGAELATPFFISPTAAQRLFHHEGEMGMARAAARFGTAYCLSSIGSTTVEDIARATPGPKWFQVYVFRDRSLVRDILARAREAGFTGVILTVDVPVAGNRERDPRNHFTVPPRVNARTVRYMLERPGYLWRLATSPRITMANFERLTRGGVGGGIMGFMNSQFDRSVTWKDAAWMREEWGGAFAIKGVTQGEDARRCAEMGAAAWVSNHGGRQLDTAPATIDVLREVVEAVNGRVDVIFDGGVRRGADVVKAVAMGASAVALGRAALFGLAAGGQAGVERALSIMKTEVERTLALLGCADISELSPRFVRAPV